MTVPSPAARAVDTTSDVVLSEIYGGGGNSGAPFTNDFIELYNRGTAAVDVTGWSVQYASSTATTWTNKTTLTGMVPAGGFYLIQEAAGATVSGALPTTNATGTINMSGTNGKVALVNNSTTLTCGGDCDGSTPPVVDFVGYGSANDFAAAPTAALSNTTSAQRKLVPFANAANNLNDFTVAAPTPGAAPATIPAGPDCTLTPLPPECVPGTTTIQDIQGSGFISPLKATTVSKVAGIVTAVRAAGGSKGFWIQQPAPDPARTSASSGVFVFTSSTTVAVGDSVLVSGNVSDFYPLSSGDTLATTSNLSITEIAPTTTTAIVSHANALPPVLVLTPTTVPAAFAPTVAGGNIETVNPVDPSRSAQEFFEAHEGMIAEIDNARVVGPGNTFGEIYLTTKPTDQATPRGGNYIGGYDAVPTGRLLVIPVSGTVPPANVGDVLSGVTAGPVDWSTFGGYDIAATRLGTRVDYGLTGTTASSQAADQLAVATYNVENLAPSDPQAKYNRLGAGVVTNLKSPDIVSVEEVQDNSGATDDAVVAADLTLTKLIAAIAAAGGPTYQAASIDPVNDADGGQPGGNIRVVFLYNPMRVTFVAKPGGDSTTAVSVSTGVDGTAELSFSPGRVDPTNTAWRTSRKPLVGEFVFGGHKIIVVANHFNSKGGDQNGDGRFQPPTRSSEIQRTSQAIVLNAFVKQVLAADPAANIVLAGDFNDYQFSVPIKTLTDDGATLTDLINTLPVNERYTYNFSGTSQVLDHILLSKSLTDFQYDVVHVNSEFADQASDHDPQVVRIRPTLAPPAVSVTDYVAVVPDRVLDTRAPGQVGYTGVKPTDAQTVNVKVIQTGTSNIPADAVAVVLNVTGTNVGADGYVTVWPCGSPRPATSNLNLAAGATSPNLVVSKIGTDGKVCVFTQSSADLIADVNGYMPAGSKYTAIGAERLLDTRPATQTGYTGAKPVADGVVTLQVTGAGEMQVPSNARAIVLNVTATEADSDGYVTVWPCGAPRPLASNLNVRAGVTLPNLVISKLGSGGTICLYTQSPMHLVADVDGYMPSGSSYVAVLPERLLETRADGQTGYSGAEPAADSTIELTVIGAGATNVPAGTAAAVLNVTGIEPAVDGFVTVWPCGSPRPAASNLNLAPGVISPNLVISKIGTNGKVCIYTQSSAHFVADIAGYWP